jgi:hypothetical protein
MQIATVTPCRAPAATVDGLLKDPATWSLWSPHVASVDGPPGPLGVGWSGRVRAFFSPVATTMTVTWAEDGRGLRWVTSAFGHRLTYGNLVDVDGNGCRLVWTAELAGPLARLVVPLVAPVSRYGQRRRTVRLARLAETVARA